MKNILIVDDSITSRKLFKAYMPKDCDCELCEAIDSESAVRMAAQFNPDIVVLDYNMPGKNGVEVAKILLDNGLRSKFVLLTANTQRCVLDAARQLGFMSVVEKPITAEKVLEIFTESA